MSAILTVLGLVVTAGAAWLVVQRVVRAARRASRLMDELTGHPGEFGRPATPGLVERLDEISTQQAEQGELLEKVYHEVFPNSGKSLRDAVDRLEQRHDRLESAINNQPAAVVNVKTEEKKP